MAPRSKSARQLKIRTAPSTEPGAKAPLDSPANVSLEQTTVPLPGLTQDADDAIAPPTPGSASRTYAQAVRSAPPSPRRESASLAAASTAGQAHTGVQPSATPSMRNAEAGHDSLDSTSIRLSNAPGLPTPYELHAGRTSPASQPKSIPYPQGTMTEKQASADAQLEHTNGAPSYNSTNVPQTGQTPLGNAVHVHLPSPVSARPVHMTNEPTTADAAAATPGGDWTLVAGRQHARPKTDGPSQPVPRPTNRSTKTIVYVDKGKARGPPGPPSPPLPPSHIPPVAASTLTTPMDWRSAPRDFYHLGTDPEAVRAARPGAPTVYEPSYEPAVSLTEDETNHDTDHRATKRPRRHSPILEDDPFVPSSKDLERMNAYETDFPMWQATPEGGQTVVNDSYPIISDPIKRAYEEGLLAGRKRRALSPHRVPIPASPHAAAASQREGNREIPRPLAHEERPEDVRGPFSGATSSVTPTTRTDITNVPTQHSSVLGQQPTTAKPYYSARPCDIQARAPTTSAWLQQERNMAPDHPPWGPQRPSEMSSGSQPFARRPPTPYPARAGSSRLPQEYDDAPWLLSPTRRGLLSEGMGTRSLSSDYAGAQPNTGRTYISRLATLEPYVPQRLIFTPAPAQGWDTIHRNDPEELLTGIDPEKLQGLWEEKAECTVLVQAYKMRNPTSGQIREVTENLTILTREITGETGFKIIAPEPTWNTDGTPRGDTAVWAIVRLSPAGARTLIEGRVWLSPILTALTSERTPSIGRFLLTLGGFTHNDDGDIIRTVWETFNGPQILPSIIRLARGNPALSNLSPEDATGVILASFEVQVSTLDNGNLVAAVFCDSPTASIQLWRQWRDSMLGIRFRSLFNSTATARRPTRCAGCHSASHLTHLCPLPAMPGFNATPPTDRDQMPVPRNGTSRPTVQGDPNVPARFTHNSRGRGTQPGRGAARRRGANERRGGRDEYDRNGYDGKDTFGGPKDGQHGFDRDEYM